MRKPEGAEVAEKTIYIATRGSALALVQANMVLAQCRAAFPEQAFDLKIIKTTGDKLQTTSLAALGLPKGLFTKELEVALLTGEADLAVHSLKDLPTELPAGLVLGAVSRRADVRDVLIYRAARDAASGGPSTGQGARRGFGPNLAIHALPHGATVATSSTRRRAQLLERRPDLNVVPIRGNVGTRLNKLAEQPELDALILAAAGLERLHFQIGPEGRLTAGPDSPAPAPPGLLATRLALEEMLPCVGQAALGIEVRAGDERMAAVCAKLNDFPTAQCVAAERAFLKAMGGGCQLAVAAYADVEGDSLRMRAVSFLEEKPRRGEARWPLGDAVALGEDLAGQLRGSGQS